MGTTSRRLDRIAVAVDFSAASLAAAEWAARWLDGAVELVLVHAAGAAPPDGRLRASDAERRLQSLGRGLGAEFVWCEVRAGTPADVVADVATELYADVVVIGHRAGARERRTDRERVADGLARRLRIPVVAIGEQGIVANGPAESSALPAGLRLPDAMSGVPSLAHVVERAILIPRSRDGMARTDLSRGTPSEGSVAGVRPDRRGL